MAGDCLLAGRCSMLSALDPALGVFLKVSDQQTLTNALPSNMAVHAD